MPDFGADSDQAQFDRFAAQAGFQAIFNSSYAEAYRAFTTQFVEAVSTSTDPVAAVDLGCGDGWTAEMLSSFRSGRYIGIDPSGVSLEKLSLRLAEHPNLICTNFQQSGEWLLNPTSQQAVLADLGDQPNLFICNATCHQLRKVFPDVAKVLAAGISLIRPQGQVIVGDYYYPTTLSDHEVETGRDWIRQQTGQNPTVRAGFYQPGEMRAFLEAAGVRITSDADVAANPHIPLRYCVFRGEKK